jgi:hypothetical protein
MTSYRLVPSKSTRVESQHWEHARSTAQSTAAHRCRAPATAMLSARYRARRSMKGTPHAG